MRQRLSFHRDLFLRQRDNCLVLITFSLLSDLFKKKSLIEKDEITEIRASAAFGLGIIGTPEALSLLEKETGARKQLLKEACLKALKESKQSGNYRR